jgi:hypothetical protein
MSKFLSLREKNNFQFSVRQSFSTDFPAPAEAINSFIASIVKSFCSNKEITVSKCDVKSFSFLELDEEIGFTRLTLVPAFRFIVNISIPSKAKMFCRLDNFANRLRVNKGFASFCADSKQFFIL